MFLKRLLIYGSLVRFSHTLFALPFALASAAVAFSGREFSWAVLGWIAAAMAGARTAAMAYNRIADRDMDAANPRTAGREIPAGKVTLAEAWVLTAGASGLLVLAAAMLNPLCLALSPVALAVVLGYSRLKRFTWFSHIGLGLSLGIAPVGAWLGVTGEFATPPLILAAAVTLWVAGFDILYGIQDVDFDRKAGLHSIPARFGVEKALWIARSFHAFTLAALAGFGWSAGLSLPYGLGWLTIGGILAYEHTLVSPEDLSQVPRAFFPLNAALSGVFLAAVLADLAWG